MHVLVVGGGGREHTLVWKIAQSPLVDRISAAPGNAGTATLAENVDLAASDIDGLVDFARKEKVGLTVVGPEAPLVDGLVDRFQAEGLRAFGPGRAGARLEGSKAFCKNLLQRNNIPNAHFKVLDDLDKALAYVEALETFPVVVKADGLAAGKGVIICADRPEALEAVRSIMQARHFGDAGATVVIEDFIEGEEASILALTDGKTVVTLPTSQDHKRALDGDRGLNTGGMGAYSPAPVITADLQERVERDILIPTIHGLRREGITYKGVLYAGLMITKSGPKVLEYNVRFGDPETQAVLMNLESDLVPLMSAVVDGTLDRCSIAVKPGYSVCVVLASGGYPATYEKDYPITGLDEAGDLDDVVVFHAGTKLDGDRVVTAGGRVLGVTARGETLTAARDRAYEAAERIGFEDVFLRRDIAVKGMKKLGEKA